MIASIFTIIYCQDLPKLTLILVVTTAIFSFIYKRYRKQLWLKSILSILLMLFLLIILHITLANRSTQAEPLKPLLIPFISYVKVWNGGNPEILRSNFMNIILFYPAGLLAAVLLPEKWYPVQRILLVVFVFALMSAAIEYAQYAFVLGQPEVDDVIHNTFGALIGGVCGSLIASHKKKRKLSVSGTYGY